MDLVKDFLKLYMQRIFDQYGIVIASLVIGFTFGYYFNTFFNNKKYIRQLNLRLLEKDKSIADLNAIVHQRIRNIKVEEQGKSFFRKLKSYFKKNSTI